MSAVQDSLKDAENFLEGLSASLKDIAHSENGNDTAQATVERLVLNAVDRLSEVHAGIKAQQDATASSESRLPLDTRSTRVILSISDLVSLLVIIPSLAPGVGVPHDRRPKSILPPNIREDLTRRASSLSNVRLLQTVIDKLCNILQDVGKGTEPILSERMLGDLISATAQLAFLPEPDYGSQNTYQERFQRILANNSVSVLLPILTSLLHPNTPLWLRKHLTLQLSLLPLRDHGVRQTIHFIAASFPPSMTDHDNGSASSSRGPLLPLEALVQATKLLSSVPSSMTADSYFYQLAPQLLALVDGEDGPEMSKAGGHIISGILGRKAFGAPDRIGWKLFALPLLESIMPALTLDGGVNGRTFQATDSLGTPVVPEKELHLALSRLSIIMFSHPNPGLTKRLVRPIFLPLWGLFSFTLSRPSGEDWTLLTQRVLESYLKFSADIGQINQVAENLMWDGPSDWTYGAGSRGGVELRRRMPNSNDLYDNLVKQVAHVDLRVRAFIKLLNAASIGDEAIGSIFLGMTRDWLLPGPAHRNSMKKLDHAVEADPMQMIVRAKLVQAMLDQFRDQLVSNPAQVLELIAELLEAFVKADGERNRRKAGSDRPTFAALHEITSSASQSPKGLEGVLSNPAEHDSDDLISIALGLLSTLVTSPSFTRTSQVVEQLRTLIPPLSYLSDPAYAGNPSLAISARNLTALLDLPASDHHINQAVKANVVNSLQHDQSLHATALQDLTSEHPPIRTEALNTIQKLINSASPVISVPATVLLLLRTVLPDPESFVFLACIRTIICLSEQDPRLAGRLLVDAFLDQDEEKSLDVRLRIGETLSNLVDAASTALAGQTSKGDRMSWIAAIGYVAQAGLALASRRTRRPKTHHARLQKAALAAQKQRDADRAWGGEAPSLDLDADMREESVGEERDRETLERILTGWEETGVEEDVRLRSSAMSILGQLVRTSLDNLNADFAGAVSDLASQILGLEKGPEKAILRRAASLALMDLVRAADAAHEAGKEPVQSLQEVRWEELDELLRQIQDVDDDEMVRGHARTALEGLNAVRTKKLLGMTSEGLAKANIPRFGLEGRLAGLEVNPEAELRKGGPPKVEELE